MRTRGHIPARSDSIDLSALAEIRRDMFRFARLHLREPDVAEDAVQDALEGALRNLDRFSGQSALKTWMFSILRHKIADVIRSRRRSIVVSAPRMWLEDSKAEEEFFDASGAWRPEHRPRRWEEPDAMLDWDELWAILELCLSDLADVHARVFTMREFLGLSTEEICNDLKITAANCHVLLHRARLRLRECMERSGIYGGM